MDAVVSFDLATGVTSVSLPPLDVGGDVAGIANRAGRWPGRDGGAFV